MDCQGCPKCRSKGPYKTEAEGHRRGGSVPTGHRLEGRGHKPRNAGRGRGRLLP